MLELNVTKNTNDQLPGTLGKYNDPIHVEGQGRHQEPDGQRGQRTGQHRRRQRRRRRRARRELNKRHGLHGLIFCARNTCKEKAVIIREIRANNKKVKSEEE